MGVDLKDLVIKRQINISELRGKKLAIDTFNILYQFLSSIRQRDGQPLTDANGNVTSHLVGLLSRTTKILEEGIKPVFVFDGKAPLEKQATQEARREVRKAATEKYEKALEEGNEEDARKYGQQTSRLTADMIHECKELLSAMGVPWVQAVGEGESQAAFMANKGHVWAAASQDYDALLFGTSRLVRNISISGRKKIANTKMYKEVKPELIDLTESLNFLGLDIQALINIAMLIGTDYNPGGVQGIGPKSALKLVNERRVHEHFDKIPGRERIENIFLRPVVTTDYNLDWKEPNPEAIKEILIARHGFSEDRVNTTIERLQKAYAAGTQQGLDSFT